jgi:hypothetical protein
MTIPSKYSELEIFSTYKKTVKRYLSELPWENIAQPNIARRFAGVCALLSLEFSRDIAFLTSHILTHQTYIPLENAELTKDLLHFLADELTDGLREGDENKSHYWFALEAAQEAGLNIKEKLRTSGYQSTGISSWDDYIEGNKKARISLSSIIGVVGLAVEIINDSIYRKILDYLPSDREFDKLRDFLEVHCELDGKEGGHGDMLERMLGIESFVNPEVAIRYAIQRLNLERSLFENELRPSTKITRVDEIGSNLRRV